MHEERFTTPGGAEARRGPVAVAGNGDTRNLRPTPYQHPSEAHED